LKVTLFPEGLTDENIDAFFGIGNSKLDLLVEVCDGLDIKIKSRYKARALRIPVVMDTNDRGMLDIERFDLEPERPILHGLAGDLNPENIKDLTNEQKIPYILKLVGAETISTRLKASMMEVEQTLNTWPQLASSVQLGGAATTDVCRRILLNQLTISGRFYLDLDELIADPALPPATHSSADNNPFQPLDSSTIRSLATHYFNENKLAEEGLIPAESEIQAIIDAAIAAPSAGNNQPWKWFYENGRLLLLHDRYRSWSWGDYAEMGSLMSLGTAIESVKIQASVHRYTSNIAYIHAPSHAFIVAEITFSKAEPNKEDIALAKHLFARHTNRKAGSGNPINPSVIRSISSEIETRSGMHFSYIDSKSSLQQMGEIIAACDRMRLLYEQGHQEFFHEVRWNHEEALKTKDGIELASVDLTESDKAGFAVARDYKAIKYLYDWNLGNGFKKLSVKTMSTASGLGIISIDRFNREELLHVGSAVLRSWITANANKVAFYPMLSPSFFFNRLIQGNGEGIPQHFRDELTVLYKNFEDIYPVKGSPVFMFRLADSAQETIKTLRMDKQDIFVS
jgi:nitroreductase